MLGFDRTKMDSPTQDSLAGDLGPGESSSGRAGRQVAILIVVGTLQLYRPLKAPVSMRTAGMKARPQYLSFMRFCLQSSRMPSALIYASFSSF